MKKLRVAGIVAFAFIAVVVLLNSGCGQGGGTAGSSSSGLPSSVPVSAEKNSFKEVTAHLDAGGNFYLYLSTEQWLDGLSGKFSDWRGVVLDMPGMDTNARQKVTLVFDLATSLVKHSGIEQISGFGISSIARDKGLYRTTSVLHHYPGNDSGYIWSAFGKKAHALDGLDLLPQNTAVATFSDLDLPLIWSAIEKEADGSGISQVTDGVKTAPEMFASATGLKLKDVLDSLGGEYGVVVTLNESNMLSLPLPGQALQMPEPALMLVFKVKNDLIFDAVDAKLKGNSQVISNDAGGVRMRTMPIPLPLPISLRPTIARSGDYLFVASTDAIINQALAVKSGKLPGLKSLDEFKKLAQGIPDKGNAFSYVSQRFGDVIKDVQAQSMQPATSLASPQQSAIMRKLMGLSGPAATAYSVSANGDDGFVSIGNGNQDASKVVLLVPVAVIGGMAGVALPAIAKARTTAARAVSQ